MRKTQLKKPSKEFERFLKIANLLRGYKLPAYSELFAEYEKEWVTELGNDTHQTTVNAREQAYLMIGLTLFTCPSEFRDYLYEQITPHQNDLDYLVNAYENFRNDFNTLNHSIEMVGRNLKSGNVSPGEISISVAEKALVSINLDSNGEFVYRVLGFQSFQGFDFRRFRTCPICKNIFWAARTDKKTCSPLCSTPFRQNEFLKHNKDEVNKQRRINYYYKNSIPYCEKCAHPNTKCNCYPTKGEKK